MGFIAIARRAGSHISPVRWPTAKARPRPVCQLNKPNLILELDGIFSHPTARFAGVFW